jgi:hypothetical protein
MGLWVDESSSGEDALMLGGQLGLSKNITAGQLTAGVGYYYYTDAENRPAFYDNDTRGNRTNLDGTYLSDFRLVEAFAEYQFDLGSGTMKVFGDYVHNTGADAYNNGWALGGSYKQDAWSLGWTYQDLEADAVLATFTDSDFIGGGTDGRGHILQASYALTKKIGLKGTLFLNDRNVDFGDEEAFKRLMLDISFKY